MPVDRPTPWTESILFVVYMTLGACVVWLLKGGWSDPEDSTLVVALLGGPVLAAAGPVWYYFAARHPRSYARAVAVGLILPLVAVAVSSLVMIIAGTGILGVMAMFVVSPSIVIVCVAATLLFCRLLPRQRGAVSN